jgi:hypothetical protein
MNDGELLMLAAKAAGMPPPWDSNGVFSAWVSEEENACASHWWNPLEDDGDAFRLSGSLGFSVDFGSGIIICGEDVGDELEFKDPSDLANVRRAIVRAAAEIGRSMP